MVEHTAVAAVLLFLLAAPAPSSSFVLLPQTCKSAAHVCRSQQLQPLRNWNRADSDERWEEPSVQWRNPSAAPRAQPAAAPQRRRRPSVDDSSEEEYDAPPPRQRRRRPRSPSSFDALNYLDKERGGRARSRDPATFKEERMDWWRTDSAAASGGIMRWIKAFYDTIFWYGVAFDDDDPLPAMDFKDVMEQYETSSDRRRAGLQRSDPAPRSAAEQRSGRRRSSAGDAMRAVRTPGGESESSDWQFKWNPGQRSSSKRDAATQTPAAAVSSSRRRSRSSRERGGADLYDDDFDEDSYDEEPVAPQQQQQQQPRRRRPQQQQQQQSNQSYDSDADDDSAAIADDSRLRKRARDLLAKQQAFEGDLAKVEERLSVLDATLELWLRRGRALAAQTAAATTAAAAGGSSAATATAPPAAASNAEVVSTKRRIYALREEGRALEAARTQLLHRLENTSANLARLRGDGAAADVGTSRNSSSSGAQRDVDSDVSDDELASADTSATAAQSAVNGAAAEPAVNGAAAASSSASTDSNSDSSVTRVDAVVVTEPAATASSTSQDS
jgi:hypothetical protein